MGVDSVNFDRTKASKYLKTKYGKAGVVILNSYTPTLKMLPKDYGWNGEKFEEPVQLSIGAGVGCGDSLPEAGVEHVERVSFDTRNIYARALIERKLIHTAKGGEGAFIDSKKHKWEVTQTAFAWNIERMLMSKKADGLGTIDTGGVTDADPTFTCVISAATWKQFNWERGMLVNVHTGTDKFEVTSVAPATRTVVLVRRSGSQDPAQGQVIYMQNSKDKEILGFVDVLSATSSTLYGVNVGYRWQSYQKTGINAVIDEEMLDEAVLDVEANAGGTEGEGINLIIAPRKQWKILKSSNVNLKRYNVPNPNVPSKFAIRLGVTALEYLSPVNNEAVPIITSRFLDDDKMLLINTRKARLKMVHEPQWFADDGTVFLRTPDDKDNYECRYGTYGEFYAYPTYHGYLAGLS